MRPRSTPMAARTASSCWRAVPLASNRMETFPQPMRSSNPTAPRSR